MACFPQPDADVLTSHLPDGEIVLLQQETGKYFSLNQTGSLIWKSMESSTTDVAIARELADRFDVTPEAAFATVSEFLHDLNTQQLITTSQERPA